MNWQKVRLIARRELRDQLRDRRTLFVIAVLPVLLYPLLGMAMLQITQFLKEHPSVIWVVGDTPQGNVPTLIENGRFRADLFADEHESELVKIVDLPPQVNLVGDRRQQFRQALDAGQVDAVVLLPEQWHEPADVDQKAANPPGPEVFFHQAKDRSRIALERVNRLLQRWRGEWVDQTLAARHVPRDLFEPFLIVQADISEKASRHAVLWSRFLPFVLMVWALTGAFYPAIDVCAGEKERGTLETLLCSPARREEIVWGKLITVMIFSMATSALNLACMVFTGLFVMERVTAVGPASALAALGSPPLGVMLWMLLALPPISALFSALAIALAAMARSTKEGQYYLIPLMVASMPLMMLPVLPSVELDLGNSLIPLTGVILLLRSVIEGEYWLAVKFFLPVAGVTALGCWMSIRWAVSQFNNEDVLFREGEQFDLGLWLVHLVRDRRVTPSVAGAFLCGAVVLVVRFFAMFLLQPPTSWGGFVWVALASQLMVVSPALILSVLLTRSAQRTFLIQWAPLPAVILAVALAVVLHPLATSVNIWLQTLYPLSGQARAQAQLIGNALATAPGVLERILVLALIPAICEELAFRGFILSGMRHIGHRWLAILLTSILFGLTHPILQQSLNAILLGLVLGYLAVQTGSLLPCIAFHLTHNALQIIRSDILQATLKDSPDEITLEHIAYAWPWVLASLVLTLICLKWFRDMPSQPSPEERLQSAVSQSSQVPASTAP